MAKMALSVGCALAYVSIPKRVSEVLWPDASRVCKIPRIVSIPKRVSEVLWPMQTHITTKSHQPVSIPKRVSEVLWPTTAEAEKPQAESFNP